MSSYFLCAFTLIWLVNVNAKNIDMAIAWPEMGDKNNADALVIDEPKDHVGPVEETFPLLDNVSDFRPVEKRNGNDYLREMMLRKCMMRFRDYNQCYRMFFLRNLVQKVSKLG